ncbi:MAG: hypothetical protein E6I99_09640 [Chloroflexi bacterium]|nr:MAG: hypothetical protein E6I99_09640 [Chloroflexota bacterium]
MDQAQARSTQGPDSKAAAALYSVAVNLVLIGAKLLVGLLTGSVAILADAAHSFLDLPPASSPLPASGPPRSPPTRTTPGVTPRRRTSPA